MGEKAESLCTEMFKWPEMLIFLVYPSFLLLASSRSQPLALLHLWVPQKAEQKYLVSPWVGFSGIPGPPGAATAA